MIKTETFIFANLGISLACFISILVNIQFLRCILTICIYTRYILTRIN